MNIVAAIVVPGRRQHREQRGGHQAHLVAGVHARVQGRLQEVHIGRATRAAAATKARSETGSRPRPPAGTRAAAARARSRPADRHQPERIGDHVQPAAHRRLLPQPRATYPSTRSSSAAVVYSTAGIQASHPPAAGTITKPDQRAYHPGARERQPGRQPQRPALPLLPPQPAQHPHHEPPDRHRGGEPAPAVLPDRSPHAGGAGRDRQRPDHERAEDDGISVHVWGARELTQRRRDAGAGSSVARRSPLRAYLDAERVAERDRAAVQRVRPVLPGPHLRDPLVVHQRICGLDHLDVADVAIGGDADLEHPPEHHPGAVQLRRQVPACNEDR